MQRFFALLIVISMLLISLTACNNDDSISSMESSESVSESEGSEIVFEDTSDTDSAIKLNLEPDSKGTNVIYSDNFVFDMQLYTKFGENHYIARNYGTSRVTNGVQTAFYPNAYNMYEYNGAVYGILTEGETYVEYIGHYCRFYDDGTYEVLFEGTYDIFYWNDKVYFVEYIYSESEDEDGAFALCSANIDGTDKQILVAEFPDYVDPTSLLFCDDYILVNGMDFYAVSPEGEVNTLIQYDDDYSYDMQFVNNGYLYYRKRIVEQFGSNQKRTFRYSLNRIPLSGGESERLISATIKGTYNGFDTVAFGGKLLVFMPDAVYVYTDDTSNKEAYSYKDFEYNGIEQILVNGDLLSVTTYSRHTVVYDTKGNIVIDSKDITYPSKPAPEKNIIANPVLFWDTTDYRPDQAYIIGAFNKDGFHTAREFPYNDRHLDDYVDDDDRYGETVETNLIDTSKELTFYDRYGSFFVTDCGEIKCYGEPIIGEAHVCADIDADLEIDSRRFIGTYSGVDIFPESIEYSENSITVDLDCDGDNEVIKWTFEEADGDYDGLYFYTLECVIDGKTIVVSDNKEWLPLEKSDFEVFIADVDMNGKYEIIVYAKADSLFSDVYIYGVGAKISVLEYVYTIAPMP